MLTYTLSVISCSQLFLLIAYISLSFSQLYTPVFCTFSHSYLARFKETRDTQSEWVTKHRQTYGTVDDDDNDTKRAK